MSLDFLARLRSQGTQPAMACVTTDRIVAERWASNAGIWPVVVAPEGEYDFSPLEGMDVFLALPQLKGQAAQRLANALLPVCRRVVGFDLETNQTSVMVEA